MSSGSPDQGSKPPMSMPPRPPQWTTPPPPRTRRPASIILTVVAAVVAFFVVLSSAALQRESHSGLRVGGRELTRTQADEGVAEMEEIAKRASAGGEGSSVADYPAHTDIGKRFKALIAETQQANAEYAEASKEAASEDFLSLNQLGTSAGRVKARKALLADAAASVVYRKRTAQFILHLVEFSRDVLGQTPEVAQPVMARQEEVAKLEAEVNKSALALLDFLDRVKPVLAKDSLLFADDKAITSYRDHLTDLEKKSKAFESAQQETEAMRQALIAKQLGSLSGKR